MLRSKRVDRAEASRLSHPDENTIAAYVSGKASPAEVDTVERHLAACPGCLDLVARGARAPDCVILSRIFSNRLSMPALILARDEAVAAGHAPSAWMGTTPEGDAAGVEVLVDYGSHRIGVETAAGPVWRDFTDDPSDDNLMVALVQEVTGATTVDKRYA